jgi:hypothetical protein
VEGTGAAPEAGVPGWLLHSFKYTSGLEWHGNIETDIGQVRYSYSDSTLQPEKVYDWRGRFVFGPMLTHDLGSRLFVRVTGQTVAWIRENFNTYQINVDDAYVQIGDRNGLWDLMAGRFLTWRVFRKGLGFDLYTLEDTGARFQQNFTDDSGFFQHTYEVNTIFLRDSKNVPPGRAAFHLYPTSWSGIEAVGTYGRLDSGGNVLGGRLSAGINILSFVNLLGGAEYVTWRPAWALPDPNTPPGGTVFVPCDTCGNTNIYGWGGSAALTPFRGLEIVGDYAYRQSKAWDAQKNVLTTATTKSGGGYVQIDPLYLATHEYSLILGGGWFHTEYLSNDNPLTTNNQTYQRHDQYAAYAIYPLGFNNAVVKLVYSRATGHQEHGDATAPGGPTILDGTMNALRLRFAFYY